MYSFKQKLFFGMIFILALLMISCVEDSNTKSEVMDESTGMKITKEQFSQAGMVIGTVKTIKQYENIQSTGKIGPLNKDVAKISSFIAGKIINVMFNINSEVSKGEDLFIIGGTEFIRLQEDFFEAKADLMLKEESYDRAKILYDEKIKSKKELSHIESEYIKSSARYKSLLIQLKQLNIDFTRIEQGNFSESFSIKAPISGIVKKSHCVIGEKIDPFEELAEIVNTDNLVLLLDVFETDASNVRKGQTVYFNLTIDPETEYTATITHVDNTIDPNSKTITCTAYIDEGSFNLSGMHVNARIVMSEKDALGLPNTALIKEDDKYFVFCIVDETDNAYLIDPVEVVTGHSGKGYTEIYTDLSGKKLLLDGIFQLVP